MTETGFVVSRDLCAAILSEDARQRRAMAWPLLGLDDVTAMCARIAPPGGTARMAEDLVVVRPSQPVHWRHGTSGEEIAAVLHVRALFEFAEQHRLQHRHDCELVVAGGAVCGALLRRRWNDVDVFFVSPSQNVQAAEKLLRGLLETFDVGGEEMLYLRNGFTVTAIGDSDREFQFVLRLYPSVNAVLGGFDLGASQAGLLYDAGKMTLVFTHLGAWSFALSANIVDVTRRWGMVCCSSCVG
jgi:hypothetical protein